MLRTLSIRNFAIIEEQSLELSGGLNALTGETGAGKSILIEALGFLLGARGSSSWLRSGASRLEVTGTFDREDFPGEIRRQFRIADTPVMVRRELDASGRTRAIVNSQSAPLSVVSALGEALVDFHGQHEHQTLLKPSVQLELLDRFGGHEEELSAVAAAYEAWSALRAEKEASEMPDEERRRRVEFGRFQLQELNEAGLKEGEEEELEALLPLLKNAERLRALAGGAYELLYEQEGSVLGQLLKAERSLAELVRIDASLKPAQEGLEAARASLDDIAHALGAYREKAGNDPGRLDQILGRLDRLARLKKKYGGTVSEMIASRERIAAELARLEGSQQRLEELDAGLEAALSRLEAACEKIHQARLRAARGLEARLLGELKALGMPQARFSAAVELEEGRKTPSGADAVEFLLAANPGEPLKPLKSAASGGELSRVMLALKTVLAKADRVPILVFDEVDAGVGGAVGRAVGQRLREIGAGRQVLCVTHLAQVACFAAAHFEVSKRVRAGRTSIAVSRLDGARRLEAVALMLGGLEATAASRRHAEELLESCAS